ncbi:MAG: hypothetical protein PVG78_17220, partial [Desulfobacterales bacterium]
MKHRFLRQAVLSILFAGFCILSLFACSDDSTGPPQALPPTEGFTFFELTSSSRLSSDLRSTLEDKLGSDAIARRSTLDLQIGPDGVLEANFPKVKSLNQRLNYSPRERIEHNITKLMYRYPSRKELPFSFVELTFSNYTGKPLVFHTTARQEGATVLQTLKEKYGPPQMATWDNGEQKAQFWRKPGELMIVYVLRDRFENPDYQVQLLFLDALEEL